MKIAVLGAGAVGLCVAGMLSKVCDVHAVTRRRNADAINKDGLIMTGIWGSETFHFPCSENLPEGADFDYIFITSKSIATRDICEQFSDRFGDADVISLQNGIGNEEIIAGYTDRVIGAMIITGFEWRGDGKVHVSVEAAPAKLGRFPGGTDERVETIVKLLQSSGINALADDNVRGSLWGKTLYNSALNPLGAVMMVPYKELLDKNAFNIIKEIINEAFLVLKEEGINPGWDDAESYLKYLKEKQIPDTAEHHSSMYQDISMGKKTEIDFINGAITDLGNKHNIDTPVNRTIVNLIKFRENLKNV